jgi:hypothetical protein
MDSQASSILSQYWTKPETARELDVCEKTLDRWHLDKMGPPRTKLGRTVLYKKSSVAAWLAKQEPGAA